VLSDKLTEYISTYERDNPGIQVITDTLYRSYANNVDIDTWANNIANDINTRFAGKKTWYSSGIAWAAKQRSMP
jgi:hypothetical protein